jgi:type IV pilus assembly protein PilC
MPFLKYQVINSSGATIEGALHANSEAEAKAILEKQGMKIVSLNGRLMDRLATPSQQNVGKQAPLRRDPAQKISPRPTVSQVANNASAVVVRQPVTQPFITTIRMYFIFTQWANLARAGISPATIFQRFQNGSSAKSNLMFREIERAVQNGSTISSEFEQRKKTFPPNVASTIAVGEMSGKMDGALDLLADSVKRSWALILAQSYLLIAFPIMFCCGFGVLAISKASKMSMQSHWADKAVRLANESDAEFGKRIMAENVGRNSGTIYLGIGIALLMIALIIVMMFPSMRVIRHFLSLCIPFAGRRAKAEAIERVSWSLNACFTAGLSPVQSIFASAGTIPNLYIRKKVMQSIGSPRENEPVSSILTRTGLFNQSYLHMITNGELIGTPGQTLDRIREVESMNQKRYAVMAGWGTYLTGMLSLAIFVGVIVGIGYMNYAQTLAEMFKSAGD